MEISIFNYDDQWKLNATITQCLIWLRRDPSNITSPFKPPFTLEDVPISSEYKNRYKKSVIFKDYEFHFQSSE